MVNGTITVYRWLNERPTGATPVWMVNNKSGLIKDTPALFGGKTNSCFSQAPIQTLAIKVSCTKALIMMAIWDFNKASVKIKLIKRVAKL